MIDIKVKYEKSDITLDFNGHAGYAPKGGDIVCAGVSALYCTLILALLSSGEKIYTYDRAVAVSSPSKAALAIIDTILVGIKGIQRSYPDYVNLTVDAREQTAPKKLFGSQPKSTFGNIALLQLFADGGAKSAGLTERREKENAKRDTGTGSAFGKSEGKEVYKMFETKDDYQKHIDSIIGGRLKDDRESKNRLEKLTGLIKKLMVLFGAKDEDELIKKLSDAADELERRGEESEEYERFAKAIESEIENLPESLKENLDPEELAHNEDFIALVACGLSVCEAIEIMDKAKSLDRDDDGDSKSKKAERPERPERPAENALSAAASARISKNAEYLTNDEIASIVKRAAKGEKIKF